MKRLLTVLACAWVFLVMPPALLAADAPPASGTRTVETVEKAEQAAVKSGADPKTTAAAATAAVIAAERAKEDHPDFLEHLVDSILRLFDIHSSGNTVTHYTISIMLLAIALLARRIVTRVVFVLLRKVASRTSTTLDDKLFPALEAPAAAFVVVIGIFSALKVLKLDPAADFYITAGSKVAFSLTIFWALWCALSAVLEHGNEIARGKGLSIAAFMPWIRKTLLTVFGVIAVLLTIESLGYDVKAILAGLGIGGLAFALAAQDTLANVFGAIVVAVDQPFKIGETVRIGTNVGAVEDIGLRSTRIRLVDKSLMVIPNKTVAAETVTNLSRFTRRRVEQVLGFTYDTKPEQMEALVQDIKGIITSQPEVDKPGVMVYFRDFGASSLDIWVVYEMPDPDFQKAMLARQRINLAIMRLAESRGLSFAFPTQTVHLAGTIAEQLAMRDAGPGDAQAGRN